MELRRKTTWENSLNKIKTETSSLTIYSHWLVPPTTGGNSANKIKTETYKSHNLHPSFLPPKTTKYFPTHAVELVIVDEVHHYSAKTKKNIIAFLQRKRKKGETDHLSRRSLDPEYFPTHAVDLVIVDEANQYLARTKKKISFVVFKSLKLLLLFSKEKEKKVKPINWLKTFFIWISIKKNCENEQHSWKPKKRWIKNGHDLNYRKKLDKVVNLY